MASLSAARCVVLGRGRGAGPVAWRVGGLAFEGAFGPLGAQVYSVLFHGTVAGSVRHRASRSLPQLLPPADPETTVRSGATAGVPFRTASAGGLIRTAFVVIACAVVGARDQTKAAPAAGGFPGG